jgi:ubiquinone biosynthesis protein UbiJ
MAGGPGELKYPAAQVEAHDLLRPPGEAEEGADLLGSVADHGGARAAGELRVAVAVIVVAVRVRDDQFVAVARVLGEPCADQLVNGVPQRDLGRVRARAGVEQDGTLVAEQQEDERRLETNRLAHPQDEGVPVAAVHLDRGVGALAARRCAVDPSGLLRPVDRRA